MISVNPLVHILVNRASSYILDHSSSFGSFHSLQIKAASYLYRDNTTTTTNAKDRYSSKPRTASPTPRKYTPCAMPKRGAMTRARHVAPFRNADGPSRLMMRLQKCTDRTTGEKQWKKILQGLLRLWISKQQVFYYRLKSYRVQSIIPL